MAKEVKITKETIKYYNLYLQIKKMKESGDFDKMKGLFEGKSQFSKASGLLDYFDKFYEVAKEEYGSYPEDFDMGTLTDATAISYTNDHVNNINRQVGSVNFEALKALGETSAISAILSNVALAYQNALQEAELNRNNSYEETLKQLEEIKEKLEGLEGFRSLDLDATVFQNLHSNIDSKAEMLSDKIGATAEQYSTKVEESLISALEEKATALSSKIDGALKLSDLKDPAVIDELNKTTFQAIFDDIDEVKEAANKISGILGGSFTEFPALHEAVTKVITILSSKIEGIDVKSDVAEVKAAVETANRNIDKANAQIDEIVNSLRDIDNKITGLQTDVADIKTNVADTKADVAEIKTTITKNSSKNWILYGGIALTLGIAIVGTTYAILDFYKNPDGQFVTEKNYVVYLDNSQSSNFSEGLAMIINPKNAEGTAENVSTAYSVSGISYTTPVSSLKTTATTYVEESSVTLEGLYNNMEVNGNVITLGNGYPYDISTIDGAESYTNIINLAIKNSAADVSLEDYGTYALGLYGADDTIVKNAYGVDASATTTTMKALYDGVVALNNNQMSDDNLSKIEAYNTIESFINNLYAQNCKDGTATELSDKVAELINAAKNEGKSEILTYLKNACQYIITTTGDQETKVENLSAEDMEKYIEKFADLYKTVSENYNTIAGYIDALYEKYCPSGTETDYSKKLDDLVSALSNAASTGDDEAYDALVNLYKDFNGLDENADVRSVGIEEMKNSILAGKESHSEEDAAKIGAYDTLIDNIDALYEKYCPNGEETDAYQKILAAVDAAVNAASSGDDGARAELEDLYKTATGETDVSGLSVSAMGEAIEEMLGKGATAIKDYASALTALQTIYQNGTGCTDKEVEAMALQTLIDYATSNAQGYETLKSDINAAYNALPSDYKTNGTNEQSKLKCILAYISALESKLKWYCGTAVITQEELAELGCSSVEELIQNYNVYYEFYSMFFGGSGESTSTPNDEFQTESGK